MTSVELQRLVDGVLTAEHPESAPSLDAGLRFALQVDREHLLNPTVLQALRSKRAVAKVAAKLATPAILAHLYLIPNGDRQAILFAVAGMDAMLRYLALSPFIDVLAQDPNEARLWEIGVDLCFPTLFDALEIDASLMCIRDAGTAVWDAELTYRVSVDHAYWDRLQPAARLSKLDQIRRLVVDRHTLTTAAGTQAMLEVRTRDSEGDTIRSVVRESLTSACTKGSTEAADVESA